jgi:hypothetical protein
MYWCEDVDDRLGAKARYCRRTDMLGRGGQPRLEQARQNGLLREELFVPRRIMIDEGDRLV